MANVNFYIAGGPGSGIEIPSYEGVSVFKYVGFFASSGNLDLIDIGSANELTYLCNQSGYIDPTIAGSGKMVNNEWVDSTGVSIDGAARVDLSSVVESGNATIRIAVTDTGNFNIQNARLRAYDGVSVGADPSGVWVLSYEIIPVGTSGIGDSQWAVIDNNDYNYFVDRTAIVGYPAATEFNYFVGISVRPKSDAASGYRVIAFRFDCDTV